MSTMLQSRKMKLWRQLQNSVSVLATLNYRPKNGKMAKFISIFTTTKKWFRGLVVTQNYHITQQLLKQKHVHKCS